MISSFVNKKVPALKLLQSLTKPPSNGFSVDIKATIQKYSSKTPRASLQSPRTSNLTKTEKLVYFNENEMAKPRSLEPDYNSNTINLSIYEKRSPHATPNQYVNMAETHEVKEKIVPSIDYDQDKTFNRRRMSVLE